MNENKLYKIRVNIAVYKEKRIVYRNEMEVPTFYEKRSQCRDHIKKEIQHRLRTSNFFISPRVDYDIVKYANEASSNIYVRYRIVETPVNVNYMNPRQEMDNFNLHVNK